MCETHHEGQQSTLLVVRDPRQTRLLQHVHDRGAQQACVVRLLRYVSKKRQVRFASKRARRTQTEDAKVEQLQYCSSVTTILNTKPERLERTAAFGLLLQIPAANVVQGRTCVHKPVASKEITREDDNLRDRNQTPFTPSKRTKRRERVDGQHPTNPHFHLRGRHAKSKSRGTYATVLLR